MRFSEQAPAANSAMSSFIHAGRQWRGVAEVLRSAKQRLAPCSEISEGLFYDKSRGSVIAI
jgi:hypothetical protein